MLSDLENSHLLGLKVKFAFLNLWKTRSKCCKCDSKSFDLLFSSESDFEWLQKMWFCSSYFLIKLFVCTVIPRPICIILPLYKAIIFIAYNYISITSNIDITIHIQSMLISLQIKEIVHTDLMPIDKRLIVDNIITSPSRVTLWKPQDEKNYY
jgi:hypothetical protein